MTMPDGQIGFVGKDVATALGYNNAGKAVIMHVDSEDKMETLMYLDSQNGNAGQHRKITIISESGLYSLILASKLPTARKFKHWVTSEVLPQIRKTGGYIPVKENDTDSDILRKVASIYDKTLAIKDEIIETLLPKARFADEVLLSPTCYTMTQLAKELSMTVNELTRRLERLRIIYRQSGTFMLYAPYLKRGYEAYRTHTAKDIFDNVLGTHTYLVWTERGKQFVHKILGPSPLQTLP